MANVSKIRKERLRDFMLDTNTVVCSYNYKHMYKLIKLLLYFPIKRIMITYPASEGLVLNDTYLIPYDKAIASLKEIVKLIEDKSHKDFVLQ